MQSRQTLTLTLSPLEREERERGIYGGTTSGSSNSGSETSAFHLSSPRSERGEDQGEGRLRLHTYGRAMECGIRISHSTLVHSLEALIIPRQPIRRQSQSWRPSDRAKAENKCRRSCDRARKKARGGPWKTPDEGGTFARPLQTTE